MTRRKTWIAALLLTLASVGVAAQDSDSTGWHFRMATGAAACSGLGQQRSLGWVAGEASYDAGRGVTVGGGLAHAGSLAPAGGWVLQGRGPRSLAPRREGTDVHAMWAKASWQVSDRLWLWGSVAHVTGFAQPLWRRSSVPVSATAISGGLAYAFSDESLLELHFHFVHDRYGSLMDPPYGGLWCGGLAPTWTVAEGPWHF